jgi:Protein of unknown function (DUF4235)
MLGFRHHVSLMLLRVLPHYNGPVVGRGTDDRAARPPGTVEDMKLAYKPIGIVLGLLTGLLSKKLFDVIWGLFDKEEPPKPTTQEAAWPKVLAAAAVQGVTFKVTRAAVDRAGAKGWNHLFGVWPGEKRQEKSQASDAVR